MMHLTGREVPWLTEISCLRHCLVHPGIVLAEINEEWQERC
jgi:hypothetical protein